MDAYKEKHYEEAVVITLNYLLFCTSKEWIICRKPELLPQQATEDEIRELFRDFYQFNHITDQLFCSYEEINSIEPSNNIRLWNKYFLTYDTFSILLKDKINYEPIDSFKWTNVLKQYHPCFCTMDWLYYQTDLRKVFKIDPKDWYYHSKKKLIINGSLDVDYFYRLGVLIHIRVFSATNLNITKMELYININHRTHHLRVMLCTLVEEYGGKQLLTQEELEDLETKYLRDINKFDEHLELANLLPSNVTPNNLEVVLRLCELDFCLCDGFANNRDFFPLGSDTNG